MEITITSDTVCLTPPNWYELTVNLVNRPFGQKIGRTLEDKSMLNGGHYISYAANPNGSWYCYNDSSCREIPNRPNIDPGSAYLLFYERQGLDYGPYLPNVENRTIPNGNLLESEDSDNDIRKLCVLA